MMFGILVGFERGSGAGRETFEKLVGMCMCVHVRVPLVVWLVVLTGVTGQFAFAALDVIAWRLILPYNLGLRWSVRVDAHLERNAAGQQRILELVTSLR